MVYSIAYVPRMTINWKFWPTLWPNGPKPKQSPQLFTSYTGRCISMGLYITHNDAGMTSCSSPSKGDWLKYVLQLHFKATNNVAEYEAVVHGLRLAISLGIWWLYIRGDSKLVINHVMRESLCKKILGWKHTAKRFLSSKDKLDFKCITSYKGIMTLWTP